MLFDEPVLQGILEGRIDRAYRRWAAPRIRVGSRMRTRVGVLEVTSIDIVDMADLDDAEARGAGLSSLEELARLLSSREGDVFRIGLRYVGPDPRVELRERLPDQAEIEEILNRLQRLDRGPQGAWTEATLDIIDRHPEVRAEDLAAMLGRVKKPFKLDVRKLKELGLTESYRIGYRLSPRGRAVLSAFRTQT